MASLRDLASGLGFAAARTILNSGNLVFAAPVTTTAALESRLEAEAAARLDVETDVVVRTAAEWQAVIDSNPFPDAAKDDPGHLVVMALKRSAKPQDVRALQAAITGREVVKGHGAQLYIVYPDGIGRSKLTAAVIEKAIGTRGTARNWNTVVKLAAACAETGPRPSVS